MKLYQRLYQMVWLSLLSCTIVPRWFGKYTAPVHLILGVAILLFTRGNVRQLAAAPVPDRLKRISKAVASLAVFQAVAGVLLGSLRMWPEAPSWLHAAIDGIHVFVSFAILAQSSSLATGYDMWEEKEIGPGGGSAEKPV
jgi:Ni/Fe-hydrogenase subunit HybB-like protein